MNSTAIQRATACAIVMFLAVRAVANNLCPLPTTHVEFKQQPKTVVHEPLEAFLARDGKGQLHRRGGIPLAQMSDDDARRIAEYARQHGTTLTIEQIRAATRFMRKGDTIADKYRVTTDIAPILVILAIHAAKGCAASIVTDAAFHTAAQVAGITSEVHDWKDVVKSCVIGALTGGIANGGSAIRASKNIATKKGAEATEAFHNAKVEAWKVTRKDVAAEVVSTVVLESIEHAFDGNALTPCYSFAQDFGITGSTVADLDSWSANCAGPKIADRHAEALSTYEKAIGAETVTASPVVPVTLYATDGTYPRNVIPSTGQVHVTYGFIPTQTGTVTAELIARNENIEYVVYTTSVAISSSYLNVELQETVPLTATTLLGLNPGNDYKFMFSLKVTHSNGFSIQYDTSRGTGYPVFIDTTANLPAVLRVSAISSGNVIEFKGSYEDPEAQTPSTLRLLITGASTQTVNLLPSLSATGSHRQWQSVVFVPNGVHQYQVEAVEGGLTYRTPLKPLRVSNTPPTVDLTLSKSSANMGEILGGTVTLTDAAGPIPNVEVGLSSNGRGLFRDANGFMVRKVTTNSQGAVTFTYEVVTSGTQTILAMEPTSNQYDLADVTVAGSDSNVYTQFTWSRNAAQSTDSVAVYDLTVYVEYPRGTKLDPGDYVYFAANHGSFRDARDQSGTSSVVDNQYTLTKAEADSGPEIITLTLPKYDVQTTHVVELPVGAGTSITPSRTLSTAASGSQGFSYAVDVSPDGRYLGYVSWSTVNITGFYPTGGGGSFTSPDTFQALCFSPDGTKIAAGDDDGLITIYNIATGQKITRVVTNGRTAITNLHWYAPDRIAVVTDGAVATTSVPAYRPRILQLDASLNDAASPTYMTGVGDSDDIHKIQCSPASSLCAASSDNGRWSLLNAAGGEIQSFVHPDGNDVPGLAFSASGSTLLVGAWDEDATNKAYLKLYSVSTSGAFSLPSPLTGNEHVFAVAFFWDGTAERLAVAGSQYVEIFHDFSGLPALVGNPVVSGSIGESLHFRMTADRELVLIANNGQWVYNFSDDKESPSIYIDDDGPVPYRQTSFALAGRITDASPIATSEYFRVSWQPLTLGSGGSFSLSLDNLVVGSNRVQLRATDRYGNQTSMTVDVIRNDDTTPPRISNCSAVPSDGDIGVPITINCTIVDDDASVASAVATIRDAAGVVRATRNLTASSNQYTDTIQTTGWSADVYIVDITATDSSTRANTVTLESAAGFRLRAPLGIPTGLIARGISTSQITVTWNVAANATAYEIYRRAPGESFKSLNSVPAPPYNDLAVSPSTTYLYVVRALADGRQSVFSNADNATTIVFSDDPLIPGVTVVRAIHLNELRQGVDIMRTAAGLPAASYSRPISAGLLIHATDVLETRQALSAAQTALGLPQTSWLYTPASGVPIRAADIQQVRDAVK